MIFHVNLVYWCVLLLTRQCLTVNECVRRPLGSCRALTTDFLRLSEFYNPQPDHFLLKTSMEINLSENILKYQNYCLNEKKLRVTYNLYDQGIAEIKLLGENNDIRIALGQKFGRLAVLNYWHLGTYGLKYNRYSPILPTFPYYLHLQVTINGTFSIYAAGNSEPFFEHQLTEPFELDYMFIAVEDPKQNNDVIAFVDCSLNCGVVEKLYDCREWVVGEYSKITNLEGFKKNYPKDVLFDEFIVVDANVKERGSSIKFYFQPHILSIDLGLDYIKAKLLTKTRKTSKIEKRFDIPAIPYAVRVLLTTGENNNFLTISNLRNNTILSMNLFEDMGSIKEIIFFGPKLYFDCLPSLIDYIIMRKRPRKTIEMESYYSKIHYHENGYNYTKNIIDTRDFTSQPPFKMYKYDFGKSNEDWCPGEPRPEVLGTLKYKDDLLEALIESSNRELLTELKKNNAQNNATADINAAILNELKKVSATADINTAELKVISDTLATHLEQNITTVNN